MTSNGSENMLPISVGNGKWDLTLYDQHRIPHEPVTDDSEITVSPRSLNSELMCPICLDMLKSTMTTKECLHRFCSDCITTALRSGNKECPTCRKKLVSKRSLRPDPNIDALIAKIYPNREEYEQLQEKALLNLNRHHSTEALQKSIEEGMKLQAELRKGYRVQASTLDVNGKIKRRPIGLNDLSNTNGTSCGQDASSLVGSVPATSLSSVRAKISEIEFILRPHPDMSSLSTVPSVIKQTRYMRTTANATIDHLINFIVIRIKLDYDEANRSTTSDPSFPQFIAKKPIITSIDEPIKIDNCQKSPEKTAAPISPSKNRKIDQQPPQLQSQNAECLCRLYVAKGGVLNAPASSLTRLNGDLTLDHVLTKFWCVKKPLEMYFFVDYGRIFGDSAEQQGNSNDENDKPTAVV